MKKLKSTLSVIFFIAIIGLAIIFLTPDYENYIPKGELSSQQINTAFNRLNSNLDTPKYTYIDYLNDWGHLLKYDLDDLSSELVSPDAYTDLESLELSMELERRDIAEYHVFVPIAGLYHLELDYKIERMVLNNITISVSINNTISYLEQRTIDLPLDWSDESKDFQIDRYGDQILPNQKVDMTWNRRSLFNNTYLSAEPLLFEFQSGWNTIHVENTSSTPVKIGSLFLTAPRAMISYQDYINQTPNASLISQSVEVDATQYIRKNSSFVHMTSLYSPTVWPFDAVYKKLNVINGISWQLSGQSITYQIEAPQAGYYKLAIHYANHKHDYSVFRTIYLNGTIPFEDMKNYEFQTTGNQRWDYHTLQNEQGEPFLFYLTQGTHELMLRADSEPVEDALRDIQLVIDHLNKFSLDIRKITGREVDRNRSWRFTEFIPETPDYLEDYQTLLKNAITKLELYAPNGSSSTSLSYVQRALFKLSIIAENPDTIPLYLEDLAGGTGSVSQYLGDSLTMIREQPMYLNEITFYNGEGLPRANASFFDKFWSNSRAFFASFTLDKYNLSYDPEVIDVWVNRPITYVDMMQKMVDQTFTPQTGIPVKISVMPDPNKLIMASAAGQQPDVALGLLSYMPFDLAIRGAAYDLSTFEDYWEVAGDFTPGAFVPYVLNDGVYALPETLDFNVIIYRKDIFEALDFVVPDTWDDVISILPELQQYGMNFYHPIAGGVSIKWFYQTSGFIYQMGGSLYEVDGTSSSITSPQAVAGLTFLNKLFTNYSLPEQVPSFYNSFRYAMLPIGIADFYTYLLIKNAAPELDGLWEIAPYPSMTVDGVENRYYIANGTAGSIMQSSDRPEEAWAFLKWWMSEETQTQFAFNLQSTYGPTYMWLSGNLKAFDNSPFPEADKDIIREQVRWLMDVPRTPGQYMLERSISDIWNTAVYDGTPTGIAVDRLSIQIDREIRKKMIEFGYLDESGREIRPFIIRDIYWVIEQMEKER